MKEYLLTQFEPILKKLQFKHLIVITCTLMAIGAALCAAAMFAIPSYISYLEWQQMKRQVWWAETHAKIALTLPPDVDLNEYLLIQKMEKTDIEHYER